ncbi:MAG: hypothetical protein F6K53_26835 [Moorea sp. SIO4A1]|nr:hypothetical protein [Moorena sp. SIO4A1]
MRYGLNAWLYHLIFSTKPPNAPYKIEKYYSSYLQIETKPFLSNTMVRYGFNYGYII